MARINKTVLKSWTAFWADQEDHGGVAAEYGVLLAGIVAIVAVAAAALGSRIGVLFDSIIP